MDPIVRSVDSVPCGGNERENVTATPAETVSVVLSGDDLEIFTDDDRKRTLKVEATYNSTYGEGLPLKEELVFLSTT